MPETDALLREVTNLYVQAQQNTIACCDIKSQTQCMVITELGRHEPLTPLALAARLGYEKSWMGRVVGQLEAEGLVAKSSNKEDGRSYLLHLTTAGRVRFEQLNLVLNAHVDRIMDFIPADEHDNVQRALLLIRDALLVEANAITSECTTA